MHRPADPTAHHGHASARAVVAGSLGRLVTRSLVYRNVDPADRRRLLVRASERGWLLQKELQELLEEAEFAVLASLSPEETRTLRGLLERPG